MSITITSGGEYITNNLQVVGTAGSGYIDILQQGTTPAAPASNYIRLYSDSSSRPSFKLNTISASFDMNGLSTSRIYTLPDSAGTIVLDSTLNVQHNSTLTGQGTSGTPLGIATTGITATSYAAPNITFNATGQATAASNILTTRGDLLTVNSSSNVARLGIGASNTFASTLNGTDLSYNLLSVSANFSGNGLGTALDLSNTTVTAGSYAAPSVTFDAHGRATAASNILTTKGDIMVYDSNTDRFAVGTDGYALVAASGSTPGLIWTPPILAGIQNISMSVNVNSNALTIQLHQANLSSLSVSTPGFIWFRNATLSTGSLTPITLSSGPSLTIPSGTTIGTSNSYSGFIYVYALNNAGSVVLGMSLSPFAVDGLVSSSAISGGASATTMYSTSAHSTLATVYLGKFLAPQTVAGTWASGATEIYLATGFDYAAGRVCRTRGDIETVGSGQVPSALSVGATGTILSTTNGTDPSWNTLSIGTSLTGNGISSSLAVAQPVSAASTYSMTFANQSGDNNGYPGSTTAYYLTIGPITMVWTNFTFGIGTDLAIKVRLSLPSSVSTNVNATNIISDGNDHFVFPVNASSATSVSYVLMQSQSAGYSNGYAMNWNAFIVYY